MNIYFYFLWVHKHFYCIIKLKTVNETKGNIEIYFEFNIFDHFYAIFMRYAKRGLNGFDKIRTFARKRF